MAAPRVRRLVLIRDSGSDERIRRYRLARLDDIALTSPPDSAAGNGQAGRVSKRAPLRNRRGDTRTPEPPR
jgi:hypothetical protein